MPALRASQRACSTSASRVRAISKGAPRAFAAAIAAPADASPSSAAAARRDGGRPRAARRLRVRGDFAHDRGGFVAAALGEQRLDEVAVVPDDAGLGDAAAPADLPDAAELRDGARGVAVRQRRRAERGARERRDAPQPELLGGAQREGRALRTLFGVAEMGEDVRGDGVAERRATLLARLGERDVDRRAGERVEPAPAPELELGEQRVRERLHRGVAAPRRRGDHGAQRAFGVVPALAHQQHVAADLHQLDLVFGDVVALGGGRAPPSRGSRPRPSRRPDARRRSRAAPARWRGARRRRRLSKARAAHLEPERRIGGEQRRGRGRREQRELEIGEAAAHAIGFGAQRERGAARVLGEGADLVAQQHRLGARALVARARRSCDRAARSRRPASTRARTPAPPRPRARAAPPPSPRAARRRGRRAPPAPAARARWSARASASRSRATRSSAPIGAGCAVQRGAIGIAGVVGERVVYAAPHRRRNVLQHRGAPERMREARPSVERDDPGRLARQQIVGRGVDGGEHVAEPIAVAAGGDHRERAQASRAGSRGELRAEDRRGAARAAHRPRRSAVARCADRA